MIGADKQRQALAMSRAFATRDWNAVAMLQPKTFEEAKSIVDAFAFTMATMAGDPRMRGAIVELHTLTRATIELEGEAAGRAAPLTPRKPLRFLGGPPSGRPRRLPLFISPIWSR